MSSFDLDYDPLHAAADDALTYSRLALTALDLHSAAEARAILSSLISRLIIAGARDTFEEIDD